jgi:hypothetical protein
MSGIIYFNCRRCDGEIALAPASVDHVTCPHCGKLQEVRIGRILLDQKIVTACIACGHEDLYTQKDFNRKAGLFVVGVGIAASLYFFAEREPFLALGALVATAVIDALIYLIVGDVTVCYACHAVYRGFARNPAHQAFDLKKLEKYGGRTPRFGA